MIKLGCEMLPQLCRSKSDGFRYGIEEQEMVMVSRLSGAGRFQCLAQGVARARDAYGRNPDTWQRRNLTNGWARASDRRDTPERPDQLSHHQCAVRNAGVALEPRQRIPSMRTASSRAPTKRGLPFRSETPEEAEHTGPHRRAPIVPGDRAAPTDQSDSSRRPRMAPGGIPRGEDSDDGAHRPLEQPGHGRSSALLLSARRSRDGDISHRSTGQFTRVFH